MEYLRMTILKICNNKKVMLSHEVWKKKLILTCQYGIYTYFKLLFQYFLLPQRVEELSTFNPIPAGEGGSIWPPPVVFFFT